jgi:hypothetical protein
VLQKINGGREHDREYELIQRDPCVQGRQVEIHIGEDERLLGDRRGGDREIREEEEECPHEIGNGRSGRRRRGGCSHVGVGGRGARDGIVEQDDRHAVAGHDERGADPVVGVEATAQKPDRGDHGERDDALRQECGQWRSDEDGRAENEGAETRRRRGIDLENEN